MTRRRGRVPARAAVALVLLALVTVPAAAAGSTAPPPLQLATATGGTAVARQTALVAQVEPSSPGSEAERAAEQTPDLVVDELDATIRPGGSLAVRGRVVNPGPAALEGLRLRATLERRTTTRLGFQQATAGPGERRGAVGAATISLGAVPPGGSLPVELRRSGVDLGLQGVGDEVAGVYPLTLTLLASEGRVLDEVRTSAVALPELVGEPVRMALVVPLDSEVALAPDGTATPDPLAGGLGEQGPLPDVAAALAAAPHVPFTVATNGFALSAAADAADGYRSTDAAGGIVVEEDDAAPQRAAQMLRDVRTVLNRAEVDHLALPFADADLVAMVRAGQADPARQAVGDGVLSSTRAGGTRPAPGVLWPPDLLDEPTLGALGAGLDVVVLRAGNLSSPPTGTGGLSPSPVHSLQVPGGGVVAALVPDPWLSPLLGGQAPDAGGMAAEVGSWPEEGEDPALAAQRVLAETAALYFEAPFAPEPRGLLLAPPQRWNPDPAALGVLLKGMAEAAWLTPVTVPELASTVPTSSQPATLVYPEEARARELSADYLAQVQAAREAVRSLGVVLTGNSDLLDAERLVQAASSVHYRDRPEEGLALAAAVTSTAQSVFDSIALIPGPMFTLTGDAGTTIPVVLVNNGGAAVEVAVSMDGGQAFRVDPPTRPVVVDPGETTTVEFSVSALTPGITAPMQVRVTDVNGQRQLATERVVVQARTTSVAALVLTAGAGLFLAVWWARDIARRRRAHRDARSRIPEPVA